MRSTTLFALVATTLLTGCFDEGLAIFNLRGTVSLPREAAQFRSAVDGTIVEDVRAIGPVYLGLYPSVRNDLESYPHPERGPVLGGSGGQGVSYPYGGTTVGDLRNACLSFLRCKVVSGRFVDYQDLVDWFAQVVGTPPENQFGQTFENGEFLQQACFQLFEYTSDEEVRITVTEDRNDDGQLNAQDLDFVLEGDRYVAEFEILQAEFFEGMSVWGFVEMPGAVDFSIDSTCVPNNGEFVNEYNLRYQAGLQNPDILNTPYAFIQSSDFVTEVPYEWMDPYATADVDIDLRVGSTQGGF